MNDTPPNIKKKQVEIHLSKSSEERAALGMEMIQFGYDCLKERIQSENPEYPESQIVAEIFRQLYRNDFKEDKLQKIASAFNKNIPSLQSQDL